SSTAVLSTPYPPSLHDALPISELALCQLQSHLGREVSCRGPAIRDVLAFPIERARELADLVERHRQRSGDVILLVREGSHPRSADRKSTRLNSSHVTNSYAVFR